ncbi:nucleotide-diphospho-sugar transferase [Cladorrhinum sp. PSN259]|nr:nucleotide-diphospho-sugar transferase [Cladorrhinum sp. PSN259]
MDLNLRPLILAGGKSVRMGSPKHLLQLPDGTPLYQHLINLLHKACPESPTIYISLAKDSVLDDFLLDAAANVFANPRVVVIHDLQDNTAPESGGPAQGLLSAFRFDPTATWLVVAVDYPLLTIDGLHQLRQAYQPPITCFRNAEGFCEPLVGIWSPEAVGLLAKSADNGSLPGPSSIVRRLGGNQIELLERDSTQLRNVNTREDWEAVRPLVDISKE